MIDFNDKTSEQNGTPINRENMMAIQGFIASNITPNPDGSITETNSKNETLTIYPWQYNNEEVTQRVVFQGEKTITLVRTLQNGKILEDLV